MDITLPASPVSGWRVMELHAKEEPLLQRFFENNPDYFLAVHGVPARPCEAYEEMNGELPADWLVGRKWILGFVDEAGELAAMANVIADLLAIGVWHIGTFIVATARHGNGEAQQLYAGLENWAVASGASWLRLGVVQGNARAERFWEARGFVQTRTRGGIQMERMVNTIRYLVKPLRGGSVTEYLNLVPRDVPEGV